MREFFNLFILLSLQFSTSTHSTQQPPPPAAPARLVRGGLLARTSRLLLRLILLLTLSFFSPEQRSGGETLAQKKQTRGERADPASLIILTEVKVCWGHPVTAEGFSSQW